LKKAFKNQTHINQSNGMNPIMTVKEARKIMGREAKKLSDHEIEKLINDLDFMAGIALKEAKKWHSKDVVAELPLAKGSPKYRVRGSKFQSSTFYEPSDV